MMDSSVHSSMATAMEREGRKLVGSYPLLPYWKGRNVLADGDKDKVDEVVSNM